MAIKDTCASRRLGLPAPSLSSGRRGVTGVSAHLCEPSSGVGSSVQVSGVLVTKLVPLSILYLAHVCFVSIQQL